MKIRETKVRECCTCADLNLLCLKNVLSQIYFCKYCGKRWMYDRRSDAAGGTEGYLSEEKFDFVAYDEYHHKEKGK